VVAIADKNFLQQNELDQHQQRALAEQNRLWYVALTRASHRVYAVFEPEKAIKINFQVWHFGRIRVSTFNIPIVR
jgi:exodeoxyribonuclease V beta subunit